MSNYEVIMTQDAIDDIVEIKNYITNVLLSPQTAKKYIQIIREKISRLEFMPNSISPIEGEPWHSRGIRRIVVKNFYIYYRPDKANQKVYILNIIYAKQDQLRILNEINIE